ncbi:MAG: helix-turn-helix domain-containing protein [Kineosporiaceae bacterium]
MAAVELAQHTYLPREGTNLAEVHDFLAAHEERHGSVPAPRYVLAGPGLHESVEVPVEVHHALLQVVSALQAGKAVTVAPQSMTLTTQQAADLLGVSRPTVVKLLDRGDIPFERIGERRKVQLGDVLEYRERRRRAQYEAIAATSVDIDDEDDPEEIRRILTRVRREAAEERRARQAAAGT